MVKKKKRKIEMMKVQKDHLARIVKTERMNMMMTLEKKVKKSLNHTEMTVSIWKNI